MPQQQTSSPGSGQQFDWWAAPAAGSPVESAEPSAAPRRTAVPAQSGPARTDHVRTAQSAEAVVEPVAVGAPVHGPADEPFAQSTPADPAAQAAPHAALVPLDDEPFADSTEVYRAVQASATFRQIRRSYRTFVFPITGGFLAWYLLYVAAQAGAPDLMRREVAGPLNVAWLLGLSQFASTFLLAWLYARNARTKRDRAALGLRWDTQDQLR
ncbi:DUF485 domain-containing protein [Kitasatospora sp. NPDC056651]|uniref:DUF485 domain-containing protein n=1 Tax=Kitasatospora sp. NPDC056651 TaxID=3345892 RepID=UPI0036B0C23E